MPKIYLSPSTQEFNNFVTGESEEYYMNLLADALVPYLYANGISYVRNTKDMTALDNIKASNSKDYDLHLALHSNAAPKGEEGKRQGTEVYYFPYSYRGERMADIIAENFSNIYPHPELIKTVPTTSLGEVD
ncbi:MAG: N-acetylmuramoyl-L-alanine amidase, partial [Oscillospiraceae bacterium]